ncbi:MAG: hypothetical protein NTV46_19485 [Verrucomicrobia bacterium]|nr:hypothetical protein [Verrucomicrobiota bacterium]
MSSADKARLHEATHLPAVDPASLTPDQLPAKVTLKADVKVTDAASEVTMTIPSGNRVKLVRIETTHAVVSPGDGPYTGSLPIFQTDLMEQLAASPPVVVTPPPVPATLTPKPSPAPEPTPAPAGTPDNTVVTPPTAPTPAPVVETAPVTAGSDDVVKVMQASLKAGQIKEFTFDQVQEWKAEANETAGGEVFQTGSISYNAETIFGAKTIQAKAYVKGGKVERWVWTKTGMEIK